MSQDRWPSREEGNTIKEEIKGLTLKKDGWGSMQEERQEIDSKSSSTEHQLGGQVLSTSGGQG